LSEARTVRSTPDPRIGSPLDPLDTDYYGAFEDVTGDDRAAWDRARGFTLSVAGEMAGYWDRAEYPLHLLRRMGELDLLADGVEAAGHPTLTPLGAGLVTMEISRCDGSLGTVIAVQGGLTMRSIAFYGSPEQKERWLPALAAGTEYGAFGLTEPDHGSDSVSLGTTAVRDGDEIVLNGEKKWIGNGSIGGVTVIWARDDDGRVHGYLVEQSTPGYEARVITGKASLRSIHQARITLTDVRIPADAVLPGTASFKDASRVLVETRLAVAWSALGHATALYEAALSYSRSREQFGTTLVSFQLVQERLARMLAALTSMQLHCLHVTRLSVAGRMRPTQASLAKFHNTRTAREIAALARDMLGGNGILLEYGVIQHLLDIESIHTYEGTESIQALLIGRDITGVGAFT